MKKSYVVLVLIPLLLILGLSFLFAKSKTLSTTKKETALEKANDQKNVVKVEINTTYGKISLDLWPDIAPITVENFVKLAREDYYNGTYFHRVIPDFMIQGGCPNTKDNDRNNDGTGGPGYTFEDECYGPGEELIGEITSDTQAEAIWTQVIVPHMQKSGNPNGDILRVVQACQKAQSFEPMKEHPVKYYKVRANITEPIFSRVLKAPVLYGNIAMANSGPNTNGSQFFIVTKKDGTPWLNGKHTVFGEVTAGMDVVHTIEKLPRDGRDNPKVENQAFITGISFPK